MGQVVLFFALLFPFSFAWLPLYTHGVHWRVPAFLFSVILSACLSKKIVLCSP